jgi:hypothetical protein
MSIQPKTSTQVINGVLYKIIKEPCRCMCHSAPKGFVKHVRACCNNGFVERHVRVSVATQELYNTLQKELDEVNASIDNYFEGDNAEYFGEEYYRNLMNRKEELEERISKL